MTQLKCASATTGPDGSYWNLLNPFSQLFGLVDRYPEFMRGVTGSAKGDYLASKIGASGLLAFAAMAGLRGLKHLARTVKEGEDTDNPAYNMRKKINYTYEPEIELDKQAKEKYSDKVQNPEWYSPENISNVALPLLALGVGGYAGWKAMDHEVDDAKEADLDQEISERRRQIWNVIRARLRGARGTKNEFKDELSSAKDSGAFVKSAKEGPVPKADDKNSTAEKAGRAAVTLPGLALLALAGFSGLASYRYFRSVNPANVKYDAMKRSLREYTKARALNTPVVVNPKNLTQLLELDKPVDAQTDPRKAIEADNAYRPVSVTV